MAIQKSKNLSDFQATMLAALADSGITNLAPGAKARAFMDIVADQLADVDFRAFANINAVLLPYATGAALDTIGDIFGVTRIQQQDAKISPYDNNLKFYVRNGTFGSLNGGNPIVIPQDTQVTSAGPNGPIYLINEATLDPAANYQYVSAVSYRPGVEGNIAERMLTVHNFRNYLASASGSLLIVNEHGITGGRSAEDDESYRYRIGLKLKGANSVNEAALRLQLLDVPGIQDVVFAPYSGGFYVYIYSISPTVSTEVLSAAQTYVNQAVAYPMNGTVLAPDLVGISFSTTLKVKPMTAAAERADIVNKAKSAAAQYISNLNIGETLYINSVAAAIRNADPRILDVGQVNNQIPEIFIWRNRSDGTRYSRYLVNDYKPETGERIIVETSVAVPINIQVAE